MKKFPGVVTHTRPYNKIVLSDEQVKWLFDVFPGHSNSEIMKAGGFGLATLQRFMRMYNLRKSQKQIRDVSKRVYWQTTYPAMKASGYYNTVRPSQACREASRISIKLNGHPLKRIKVLDPKRYAKIINKRKTDRLELYKEETKRMCLGLHQHTKLHIPQFKYTKSQVNIRLGMSKVGYIIGDKREIFGERYTIYYDDETNRSQKREAFAIKNGFVIKRLH